MPERRQDLGDLLDQLVDLAKVHGAQDLKASAERAREAFRRQRLGAYAELALAFVLAGATLALAFLMVVDDYDAAAGWIAVMVGLALAAAVTVVRR